MLQAVGMHDSDGKKIGYRIHHEGKVYEAFRTPDERFECEGFVGTLKQVKQNIEAGGLDHFADKPQTQQETTQHSPQEVINSKTWDCVPPCALLIIAMAANECGALPEGMQAEIQRSLDAYGWITPEGKWDVQQAQETFETWKK